MLKNKYIFGLYPSVVFYLWLIFHVLTPLMELEIQVENKGVAVTP